MSLELVLRRLKNRGYKITPQRRLIIRALVEAVAPRTAQQVYQDLRTHLPDTGLDTVYRTLRLLTELGVANQITGAAQQGDLFELAQNHHHHMVCLRCGQVLCLDACAYEEAARRLARARNFSVTAHVFEVYGYCQACQAR